MLSEYSNRNNSIYEFKTAALGGTFDHFHKGHRRFLKKAFEISHTIIIGITTDNFAREIHKSTNLQTFLKRKSQVNNYIKTHKLNKRSKLIPLEDTFGPTVASNQIQVLIVTQNTLKGANSINKKRIKTGKKPLAIIKLPLVKAENGVPISSYRIRQGEINKEGVVFLSALVNFTPLKLPIRLRSTFREPFGEVISTSESQIDKGINKALPIIKRDKLKPLICVGDVVTHAIVKAGKIPRLSIIDFHVQRKRRHSHIAEFGSLAKFSLFEVENQASEISHKLTQLIHKSLKQKKPSVILVDGEEDLAVLPAVLLAPLGSVILYGHFQEGLILVKVTEDKKSEALLLLNQLRTDKES